MYENERWGPPLKHNRYPRVEDKEKFGDGIERIFGKKDPKSFQQGRRTRKKFHIKSLEELERDQERS